ncbi:MAG: diacylglycerol kinase family protein [Ignavibacteriaceae bacterium]|nr:diacylglycerol kinase family protein [Ignavibacteriaceae bacterium]
MFILFNNKSCGGNAAIKWQTFIKNYDLNNSNVIETGKGDCKEIISFALSNGETEFTAAGGDGTVNYLLNTLISCSDNSQISSLKLGAIGLGSSNDLHKPYEKSNLIGMIPFRLNFSKSEFRDVGKLTFISEGNRITKYFLINASIGITAEGNFLFNNPDRILSHLKNLNTNSAILYSALKTISGYSDITAELKIKGANPWKVNITNLNIVKNPNITGNLSYGYPANYNNGKFNVHLAHDMSKLEVIQLFLALQKGKIDKIDKLDSFSADEFEIISDKLFNLEYDGEVIQTDSVLFSIKKEWIKVCTC